MRACVCVSWIRWVPWRYRLELLLRRQLLPLFRGPFPISFAPHSAFVSQSFWLDSNHSKRKWCVCWLPRSTVRIPSQAKDVVSYLQISWKTRCTTGLVASFSSQYHSAKAKLWVFCSSFPDPCCLHIKVGKCNLWYENKDSGAWRVTQTVPVQVS